MIEEINSMVKGIANIIPEARKKPISCTSSALHFLLVAVIFSLAGCGEPIPGVSTDAATRASTPRILAMGDSMLAWNRETSNSISDAIENELDVPVTDRSVIAARFNYALPITGAMGLNISKQYRGGNWDWVVMNGGGNDLWLGCGCVLCDHTMDKLISANGRWGKIPDAVSRARNSGARVIYLGYLHSPGNFSIIDHCKSLGLELDKRLARMAANQTGVFFLPLSGLVPYGDTSFHSVDMIHPSAKAARVIGSMVAQIINAETSGEN